ncbi:MAG: carbohydrate binding domain-containing protein [Patescibacteria group bacterium]
MQLGLHNRQKRHRFVGALLALVFLFTGTFGAPQRANAQAIKAFTTSVSDIWTSLQTIGDKAVAAYEKAADIKTEALKESAAVSFRQGVSYFLNKIASDTAVWIASGGKGQKPLFITQGWGSYLTDAAEGAAGAFVDGLITGPVASCQCRDQYGSIEPNTATEEVQCLTTTTINGIPVECQWTPGTKSDSTNTLGLIAQGLCAPDADIQLSINLGLANSGRQRAPKCTFSRIKHNWEQLIREKNFLPTLSQSFNPSQSDLGIALTLQSNLLLEKREAKERAEKERLEAGGYKPVTGGVGDVLKLPGQTVRGIFDGVFKTTTEQNQSPTGTIIGDAVDIFVNTLATNFLKNLISGGFSGNTSSSGGNKPNLSNFEAESATEGVLGAQARLAQELRPRFTVPGRYDVLSQLVSCQNTKNPGPNDCVITDSFRNAVSQRLTVREAVDRGLINADAPFGFVAWDPQSVEPSYNEGIPYRSILILRKYRIVPVGWELAARYIERFQDDSPKRVTLGELLNLYDQPELPGGALNPYYHLVDPSWVLVPPDSFCKLQGSGPQILSQDVLPGVDSDNDGKFTSVGDTAPKVAISRNANYCADEQTCIARDNDGNCKFYGYCTEEKQVWDFGGKSCSPQFSSCTTLKNELSGTTVSYLLNTVDFSPCDASSVGCAMYSATPLSDTVWSTSDVIFLNNQAETCSKDDAGCRKFIRTGAQFLNGLSTNLVRNPGFEVVAEDNSFTGWTANGGAVESVTEAQFSGSRSLKATTLSVLSQSVLTGPLANQTVTLSFEARGAIAGQVLGYTLAAGDAIQTAATLTTEWQHYEVRKTYGATAASSLTLELSVLTGVAIDNVKIQLGAASAYSAYGEGASNSSVYLKRAPAYLSAKTDIDFLASNEQSCRPSAVASDAVDENSERAECQPYARYCTPQEAGCLRYTPTNRTTPVTAVSGSSCPGECVGFDTYTQGKTFFESVKFVDLIPTSGERCSAAAVGCDEFTNLDTTTQGGESREFYQQVRFCELPGRADAGTFYTWEGSDDTGFQLRVFTLKKTDVGVENYFVNDVGDTGVDSAAPCTKIDWSDDGQSATCADTTQTADPAWRTCNENTYQGNPDCRQFYNEAGLVSYRLLSHTISVTDQCRPLRKTTSNTIDCEASNGWWNSALQACLYQAVPGEGRQCNAAVAGCREYRGGTAARYRTILNDTFERGTGNWEGGRLSPVASTVGGHSYEILDRTTRKPVTVSDGSSTAVDGSVTNGATYVVSFSARAQNGDTDSAFVLSFERKSGEVDLLITDSLTNEWQTYQSDPVTISVDPTDPLVGLLITHAGAGRAYVDNVTLRTTSDTHYLIKNSWQTPSACFAPDTGEPYLGCQSYRVSDGSERSVWEFGGACHDKVVGCEAVIDTQNTTIGEVAPFAKTFAEDSETIITVPEDSLDYIVNDPAKTCKVSAQGCELLGKANLSTASASPTLPLALAVLRCHTQRNSCVSDLRIRLVAAGYDKDLLTTPGIDENLVAKFDSNVLGAKDALLILRNSVGLGDPNISTWTTGAVLNNPDTYDSILCRIDELQCSAFTDSGGSTYYFKDPGSQICEYRTDKPIAGWYVKGTISLTPDCNASQNDPDVNIHIAGGTAPSPQSGFTGVCPAQQNSCREFIDPRSDGSANILYNGEFILKTDDKPVRWKETVPGDIADVEGGVKIMEGGLEQERVALRTRTLYVLSAEVKAVNAAATKTAGYVGIDCGVGEVFTASDIPYAFAVPRSTETFERFSTQFYVSGDDQGDCTVSVGLAASLLPRDKSEFTTNSGVIVRAISLREAGLHYELANGVSQKDCAGTVNNANCVLVGVQQDFTQKGITANFDADTSPTSTKVPNSDSRGEYVCITAESRCVGTDRACTNDSDCQLQKDATFIASVQPGRECGAWLSCRTARTVVKGGVTNNVCLEVEGCQELDDKGNCIRRAPDVIDTDLTYTAATVDLLRNRSGYSKVGFDWTTDPLKKKVIQGYLAPGMMSQIGQLAGNFNGTFESASIVGEPFGWVGWGQGQNMLVIGDPLAAQDAGISYPAEGKNVLEVNANHADPDANHADPDDDYVLNDASTNLSRFIPVTPNTEYVLSALVNTRQFTGESSEVRVFEYNGIAETIPNATGDKFSALLNLGRGTEWTIRTDKFTTASTTSYVRLQLSWVPQAGKPETSGFWYIDDIKLQPALEYQKNEFYNPNDLAGSRVAPDFPPLAYERGLETLDYKYASQSCRLYPQADALSCSYFDDNGLKQRGKLGYCLEWDTQNKNYCIQWWPVDNVIGEDSEEDRAGYDGPVPLYQCIETYDGFLPATSNNFYGVYYNGKHSSIKIEDPWESYQIEADSTVVIDLFKSGFDGLPNVSSGGITDKPGTCNRDGGDITGCEIAIRILKASDDEDECAEVYVGNKMGQVVNGDDSEDGDVKVRAAEVTRVTTRKSAAFLDLADLGPENSKRNYRYLKISTIDTGCDQSEIRLWVRPNFACTAVLRTVDEDGTNKAYASRVTSGATYPFSFPGGLTYGYSTDSPPFGSAVPPAPAGDPTQWDTNTEAGKQALFAMPKQVNTSNKELARAGGPYSCLSIGSVQPFVAEGEPWTWGGTVSIRQPACASYLGVPGVVGGRNEAVKLLQNLFVKSYGMWEWKNEAYTPATGAILTVPDERCKNNVRPEPDDPDAADACFVYPGIPKAVLDTTTVKDVGVVGIRFTAVADSDQEPIVQYIVDWRDGSKTTQTGLRLSSRSEIAQAISLTHNYSFDQISQCKENGDCGDVGGTGTDSNPFTVKPQVQILDNWGFCSGSTLGSGDSLSTGGCTGSWKETENEVEITR